MNISPVVHTSLSTGHTNFGDCLHHRQFQNMDSVVFTVYPDAMGKIGSAMNESQTPPKNIVLVGFMGSGKSTVGRELHQRLGYPLVDMDQVIEQRAGKPITAIFAEDGEEKFREMETLLLEELCDPTAGRRIISTGGGVVGRQANRALLRQLGYVVWLHAPTTTILDRTAKNRDRPLLLTEDPVARIEALLAERKPSYAEVAHLKVDTAGLDCNELATGILESARYFFTGHF
jgi:shikimate kinase